MNLNNNVMGYLEDDIMDYPFHSHIQDLVGVGVMANAHYHKYIEILYCLAGKIKIFLDGKEYQFCEGDMIVINSREVHHIIGESSFNKYIVLKFEPEILYVSSKSIFEVKYVLPFTMNKSTHQKLFTNDETKTTFVPQLLHDIYDEYTKQEYGFELAIRTHICRIFLWILRGWNKKGLDLDINNSLNDINIMKLEKAILYVSKNYPEEISVYEVAELCNMSYSYFSRFFKSIMKKNFSEYVNYVRINEAEKLLITTDLNITEIAGQVGFSTSSYFIQIFKAHKKVSPKQFRSNFKR